MNVCAIEHWDGWHHVQGVPQSRGARREQPLSAQAPWDRLQLPRNPVYDKWYRKWMDYGRKMCHDENAQVTSNWFHECDNEFRPPQSPDPECSRPVLGCGRTGYLQHEWHICSGAIMWCNHVNMDQSLKEMFLIPCGVHAKQRIQTWGVLSTISILFLINKS